MTLWHPLHQEQTINILSYSSLRISKSSFHNCFWILTFYFSPSVVQYFIGVPAQILFQAVCSSDGPVVRAGLRRHGRGAGSATKIVVWAVTTQKWCKYRIPFTQWEQKRVNVLNHAPNPAWRYIYPPNFTLFWFTHDLFWVDISW